MNSNQLLDANNTQNDLSMIDRCFADYLSLAQKFIRQPSISLTGQGIPEMVSLLLDELCGLGAEIVHGAPDTDPPVLHARMDAGKPVTVLLYGMYDVMPAEEADWKTPPFAAEVVFLPDLGECLVGRGAENSKGPLAGIIYAIRCMLDSTGSLPVNLELVIEGQEENGSRNLRAYLEENAARLNHCDVAIFPEFCEYGKSPRVYLGFKGIVHGRVEIRGGEWGGPTAPTHSSNLPWIDSPAWRLVNGLNRLASPRGDFFRQGPGNPLSPEDEVLLRELARSMDIEKELRSRNVSRPVLDQDPVDMLKRLLSTTSLNLSRLESGLGQAAASIPAQASARFDLRLPPGVSPQDAMADFEGRLKQSGLGDFEVTIKDSYPGSKFSMKQMGLQPLLESYKTLGRQPEIWPFCPGSAPAYAFDNIGAPLILGGLGAGGNAHGANEYAVLQGMNRFAQSLCLWLHGCAAEGGRRSS